MIEHVFCQEMNGENRESFHKILRWQALDLIQTLLGNSPLDSISERLRHDDADWRENTDWQIYKYDMQRKIGLNSRQPESTPLLLWQSQNIPVPAFGLSSQKVSVALLFG
jgi:hypothetical protein